MKTLKDYMKEHHPEFINPSTYGGVCICPTTVSDFNHLNLKPLCDGYTFPINHGTCCTACWDQPYTPPNNIEETHSPEPAKTYEDGLNEAWKFAQYILTPEDEKGISDTLFDKAFPEYGFSPSVVTDLSYAEAKSRYDKAIEETIKIGDEITNGISTGYVLYVDNKSNLICAKLDTYSYPQKIDFNNPHYHKTGKHNSKLAEAISEITEDPQ